jgi:hypothetical protein
MSEDAYDYREFLSVLCITDSYNGLTQGVSTRHTSSPTASIINWTIIRSVSMNESFKCTLSSRGARTDGLFWHGRIFGEPKYKILIRIAPLQLVSLRVDDFPRYLQF